MIIFIIVGIKVWYLYEWCKSMLVNDRHGQKSCLFLAFWDEYLETLCDISELAMDRSFF